MSDRVTDNSEARRFEMALGARDAPAGAEPGAAEPGRALAFVAYRRTGDVLTLDHAEVPPAFEGQGVGSRLVKATLDDIRARGLKIIPRCGFVRAYMHSHPEFNDLLGG